MSSKSVQWETSCSMWTDMTKLIAAFRNFANVPKKAVLKAITHLHVINICTRITTSHGDT